jgi:hypothetical protein
MFRLYLQASEEKRRKMTELSEIKDLLHTYDALFQKATPVPKLPRAWDGNRPLSLFSSQPLSKEEILQKATYSADPKKPRKKVSEFVTEDELEAMIEKRKQEKENIRNVRLPDSLMALPDLLCFLTTDFENVVVVVIAIFFFQDRQQKRKAREAQLPPSTEPVLPVYNPVTPAPDVPVGQEPPLASLFDTLPPAMLLATMRPVKVRKINTGEGLAAKMDDVDIIGLDGNGSASAATDTAAVGNESANGGNAAAEEQKQAVLEEERAKRRLLAVATFEEYTPDWSQLPSPSEMVRF